MPTSGLLTYKNCDLTNASDDELTSFRRDTVGFISQAYNLIPSLTARENVALTSEITRDPMTPEEALTLVGLADRIDFFPSQFSGGQQQRVAIARAIAKRPQVLLCDEPTGALDLRTSLSVLDTIERANRELGTLTVIITHNAILGEIADRVIRLSNGRISTSSEIICRGRRVRWNGSLDREEVIHRQANSDSQATVVLLFDA